MSDTIKWSFSADRCFRRCQRQYFLSQIAAHHSAKDPVRREAFLAKQVKTVELWQGSLVHTGLERFVVPAIEQHRGVAWDEAIAQTQQLARRQFSFSASRRYREVGMTKKKGGDDYCALVGHESEAGIGDAEFARVLETIERSLVNLSQMTELLEEIQDAGQLWCELPLYVTYDIARLEVHLDLMFFRSFGKPTIVDWKVSESLGGSDADLQTGLYAWALCQHPRWRVESAEDCELVEVQLLKDEVIRHRSSSETFDRIENRIYRSVNKISALRQGRKYDVPDIEEYDFAQNPNSCSYCSLRALCQELAGQQRAGCLNEGPTRRRSAKESKHAKTCFELF